ncbi:flagellar basal body rod protein FlgF [Thiomicrorhabdus lithotrophica]|uniref:Flagellar basal-body rod protein FlgF n=1 Tax=Thiomicrorhabdus lithotrophica TaxID=2949997 RepID=A0ABY8CBL0_9GAMM|nr:flagellar basal body rod protein FlgF [Thiomicrorhabdus lithotrophica]WEJ63350.1 flagellar basal body rod protein FlgF [Thiomicrorhabdus lithotrophica]
MDRMLYVAMSGAKEVMLSQANNANNLANANTDGFKQDFNIFRAQHMQGPGWNSRAYSMDERPATDFSPGAIKVTGRGLDVVTKEDGFIGIQSPTGDEAFIRSASLQVLEDGSLVDVKGNPILNEGGAPINVPPSKTITIGDDGTISIVPADSPSNQLVVLDQLRLVKPNTQDLEKGLDGFTRLKADAQPVNQEFVSVVSGALESSNVNTAEALVNMIELSRKYELQVKMMSTTKTHAQKSDQLLSLR